MPLSPETKAGRSWFVPRCASCTLAWIGLLWVSCLNPRPEELPSHDDDLGERPVDSPDNQPTPSEGSPGAATEPAPGAGPSSGNELAPPVAPGSTNNQSPEVEEPDLGALDAGIDSGPDGPPLADPSP